MCHICPPPPPAACPTESSDQVLHGLGPGDCGARCSWSPKTLLSVLWGKMISVGPAGADPCPGPSQLPPTLLGRRARRQHGPIHSEHCWEPGNWLLAPNPLGNPPVPLIPLPHSVSPACLDNSTLWGRACLSRCACNTTRAVMPTLAGGLCFKC